jgi:hypothetical protein
MLPSPSEKPLREFDMDFSEFPAIPNLSRFNTPYHHTFQFLSGLRSMRLYTSPCSIAVGHTCLKSCVRTYIRRRRYRETKTPIHLSTSRVAQAMLSQTNARHLILATAWHNASGTNSKVLYLWSPHSPAPADHVKHDATLCP